MLDVFKSDLKERGESIERRINQMIGELEEMNGKISDLKQPTPQSYKEIEDRVNSIEKKLLMGKYAPK